MKKYQKILILKLNNNSFEQWISEKMEACGAQVASPYPLWVQRERHLIKKTVTKLLNSISAELTMNRQILKSLPQYERVILFDACLHPGVLQTIKKYYGGKLILWLWNLPSDNLSAILQETPVFDSIVCFDPGVCEQLGYRYLHQFYFMPEGSTASVSANEHLNAKKLFFCGSDKNRLSLLEELSDVLTAKGYLCNFTVVNPNRSTETRQSITLQRRMMDYPEMLQKLKEYDCLVDLVRPGQQGLTLRTLEALFYCKKLLTNNACVKQSDFYRPENIFIVGEDAPEDLAAFFDRPFQPVEDEILKKYTFEHWCQEIALL